MVKWLSNVAGNRFKSLVPSTIITLIIVAMLIISGPAQAVAVSIAGLQDSYTKGNDIDFQVKIDINDHDQYVSITNISLGLTGPINKTVYFALDGTRISGDCNIKIKPVSIPKDDYGYGNGYGYDTRAGYGYDFGYGYGYGYGYGGGGEKISFIYNVTMHTGTTCLPTGNYNVVASLNTGKNVAFQSPTFSFRLLQGATNEKIKAKVDIKPETINLASKGKFTAFITLPEDYDVRDIDVGTVVIEGAHAVNSTISKENGGTLIAKFNKQDLVNVQTGNAVKFNVTGEVDGTEFEGNDTVKVIDNGKDQEVKDCEYDEHVKENDRKDKCDDENESDDQVKEQDHEYKKVKDQTPEKNKADDQKNSYNGGQGKNVIVNNNNININNNSGTININIYNQGSGTGVNQGGNNNNNANGNKKGNQGNNNKKGNNGKNEK